MTIQIALRAANGIIVFASDLKVRTLEEEYSSRDTPTSASETRPKIVISKRHDIAIAMAGNEREGAGATEELTDFLSGQEQITDENFSPLLKEWGNRYFQKEHPGEVHKFSLCSFLAVNPRTEYAPLWKLRVRHNSDDRPSESVLVNGNENSSVIFLLDYFRCDKNRHGRDNAMRIAAFVILLAGEVNPHGVSGLEIWVYDGGWSKTPSKEIEKLQTEFKAFQEFMHSAVLR